MKRELTSILRITVLILFLFMSVISVAQVFTIVNVKNSFSGAGNVYQSNLKLTVKVDLVGNNTSGTVYYVVYKTKPSVAPTGQQIESYVNGSSSPADIIAKSSVAVNDNFEKSTLISLNEKTTYYTYIVCKENQVYTPVKSFTNRLLAGKKTPNLFPYVEYLPPGFNTNNQYALLVFLHGSGEIGSSSAALEKVLSVGLPTLLDQGKELKAVFDDLIVVCPQAPVNIFDLKILDAFLEDVKIQHPNIDLTRIYMTGLSMGGNGTWEYALRHPDKLAAIAPISGKGDNSMAYNIRKLPIWAFSDYPDRDVHTSTINMENKINTFPDRVIPRVTLYNYATSTHSAWGTAYSDNAKAKGDYMTSVTHRPEIDPTISPAPDPNNIYDWLKLKKRADIGPIVNIDQADMVNVSPGSTVELYVNELSGASYRWERVSSNPSNAPALVLSGSETSKVYISNFIKAANYIIRVTMTDARGYIDTDEISITTVNQVPVVDAGPDRTVSTQTVTFSGSGSDPDGLPIQPYWSYLNGPSSFSLGPNWQAARSSLSLTINNLVPGTYTFRLEVSDNITKSIDDVKLTVINTANAGPDKTIHLPTNTTTLTGAGTVPSGPITYLWSKLQGPAATLLNESTSVLAASNLVAGTYVFRLTVKDATNVAATDDVTVIVNEPPVINEPPVVYAGGDQSITVPISATLNLTGSASDADGISTYAWTKLSGPSVTMNGVTSPVLTLTNFTSPGIYTFRLTATDSRSAVGYDEVTVLVSTRIEAEALGNTIIGGGSASYNTSSGGKSVILSMNSGKLTFAPIQVASGSYKIQTRVRTGAYNSNSYDQPTAHANNYKFRLNTDPSPLPLTLDATNAYVKDINGTYWGLMNSVVLSLAESNTLEVTVTNDYLFVDYIDLIPVQPSSLTATSVLVEEFSDPSGMKFLYPNPASDKITVVLPGEQEKAAITIVDGYGKVFYSIEHKIINEKIEIDISHLPKGIFLFRISSAMYRDQLIRFVKE